MPDPEPLREMRALVDELAEDAAALQALGEEADVPAIERNAARLQGVIEQLDRNLPPELLED